MSINTQTDWLIVLHVPVCVERANRKFQLQLERRFGILRPHPSLLPGRIWLQSTRSQKQEIQFHFGFQNGRVCSPFAHIYLFTICTQFHVLNVVKRPALLRCWTSRIWYSWPVPIGNASSPTSNLSTDVSKTNNFFFWFANHFYLFILFFLRLLMTCPSPPFFHPPPPEMMLADILARRRHSSYLFILPPSIHPQWYYYYSKNKMSVAR